MKMMIKRRQGFMRMISVSMFCMLMSSCAYQLEPVMKQDRIFITENIESALVVPFLCLSDPEDVKDLPPVADIFASELARFRDVAVTHPSLVQAYMKEHNLVITKENVYDVADTLAAAFDPDVIIIGSITEYSTYYPPVMGIHIEVKRTHSRETLLNTSMVCDARYNYIRASLKDDYAMYKTDNEESLYKQELVLQKIDLFTRFVCYRLIKRYL